MAPGTPEIREHRIHFWDKGIDPPSSDCNPAQLRVVVCKVNELIATLGQEGG